MLGTLLRRGKGDSPDNGFIHFPSRSVSSVFSKTGLPNPGSQQYILYTYPMDTFYQDRGEQFLRRECCRYEPTIVAALLGGSQIYHNPGSDYPQRSSDWDGALLLATKLDIAALVNKHRQTLLGIFDIAQEECPHLRVPDPSSENWDSFDAVRFVGFTKSGTRKSVKILSWECFSAPKTALNILSFKDTRVFEGSLSQATMNYRVHQATRLEDGLFILHDQWIFKPDPNVCVHGNDISPTSFGITADLLASGAWLFGEASYGQLIQTQLFEKFAAASNRHATLECFARFHNFSDSHRKWLGDRLAALNASIPVPIHCGCVYTGNCFAYGSTTHVHSKLPPQKDTRVRRLPPDLQLSCEMDPPSRQTSTRSIFTSNSHNYVTTIPANSVNHSAIQVFFKRSQFQEQEIRGAEQAARFYPQVQIPSTSQSGHLLYPFFKGQSEAEHRSSFIHNGRNDRRQLVLILNIELAKAEDMLRAYRQSFQTATEQEKSFGQSIHRFYYTRLVNDTRLKEFYSAGINVHGHLLPLTSFLSVQLKVNGVPYPPLGQICRDATEVLHPMAISSCPSVFGLGDAHGANIMISDEEGPDNRRELLYIDYEVAGYHSVMLDLAKPLYNDVFFEMLYADYVHDAPRIEYAVEDGTIKITMVAWKDQLGKEILNIKRHFLIDPLFQYSRDKGCDMEGHVSQLAYALFSCACLTRNFNGDWDSLFRNIAVGVVLSQAANLDELWDGCRSFGF